MELKNIYRPIERELKVIEEVLEASLKESKDQSILRMGSFLLDPPGKRIRPALVILSAKALSHKPPYCAKASEGRQASSHQLIKIASAFELIHIASLVHDDVIDHSLLRHNLPTVNSKWGQDVSIALGDYLYSVAFELISTCGNSEILECISSAAKAMCEGELQQVCQRDNLNLSREQYILIVKKKTASLFAACCRVGALISNPYESLQNALKEYGLNFGIAFQIIDDYLDLVGEGKTIGKTPGQDIRAGEITLPILNLWESIPCVERKELETLLAKRLDKEALQRIRERLIDSEAAVKTKEVASSFINLAKEKINILSYSPYKESLLNLADFIMARGFNPLWGQSPAS